MVPLFQQNKMKYEITNIEHPELKGLFRIRALKDFGSVRKGDLGGFIQSDYNLSQDGDCWIFNDACVFYKAQVYENARITEKAQIYGNAKVYGDVCICGYAKVFENAEVCRLSWINGNAEICGDAKIELNRQYFNFKINKGQITDKNLNNFLKLEQWFPYFSMKQNEI